jgi:hypothetical protein
MRFDTASSSPKLHFKATRPLGEEEIVSVIEAGKTKEAQRAIGATTAELDGAKLAAPDVKSEDTPVPAVKAESTPAPTVKEPTKREKEKAAAPKDVSAILDDWAK